MEDDPPVDPVSADIEPVEDVPSDLEDMLDASGLVAMVLNVFNGNKHMERNSVIFHLLEVVFLFMWLCISSLCVACFFYYHFRHCV